MTHKKLFGKVCSVGLCLCLLLSCLPASAFAITEDGLCDHHPEHTEECGYSAAVEGQPCTHEHTDDCYSIVRCVHEHNEDCGENCTHVCSEESGCVTVKHNCHHNHDEHCGYSESLPASECTHECGEECIEGCVHEHDDTCGYAEEVVATPCNHVCSIEDGCYELVCSHAISDQHDDTCGYVEAKDSHPCGFVCKECAAVPEVPAEDEQPAYTDDSTASTTKEKHTFVNEQCTACDALDICELNIADGTIILSEENGTTYYQLGESEKVPYTEALNITGSTEENTILIKNGTHNVIFTNLNIAVAEQVCLTVEAGTVNLTLIGENVLGNLGYEAQSILLGSGTLLTTTASSMGSLYLTNGISDQNNYAGSAFPAYTRDLIDGDGSLCINGGTVGLEPSTSGMNYYTTGGGIGIQGDLTVTGGSLTVGFIAAKNVTIIGGSVSVKGLKGLNCQFKEGMYDRSAPSTTHGIFASNNIVISGGAVDVLTEGPACCEASILATIAVNQSHALYGMNAVTISGGTVKTAVERYDYDIDDMGFWQLKAWGDADDDWGFGIYSETITITGGNVKVSGSEATNVTPTNRTESVYVNTLTLADVTRQVRITALQDVGGYGLNNVMTLDTNKLYFYLPNGANVTEITANGRNYTGTLAEYSGTYTYAGEAVSTVSITWGDMNFTYSDGTWNTETYVYDGAGWTGVGNTVTVENSGHVTITASVAYQNEDGYHFTGSWDKETASIPITKSETFTLTLSGKPAETLDKKKVGTVTVTIQQADETI